MPSTNSVSTNGTKKALRVGCLYEDTQMTDLAGMDVLGNLTPKVVDMVSELVSDCAQLKPYTVPMEFLYISSSLELASATPDMLIKPTHTYETAPRDLDILLIGGPNPYTVKEESLVYLREASKQTKIILTTCTGGMWLAKSGALDGKKATTNRVVLENAKKMFPNVEWLDQRWVTDKGHFEGAEIWTAGGAGCGIDMTIEYTDRHFHKDLVRLGCVGLDFQYEGRQQFYKAPLASLM
ncbi:class I glutamine amidotransferase-like protein [Phaeosphaeriaceae sp. PMI808]|nr:class I glutamine amidotransferase-like protein [Phaeosphaeriaceae sp. PMI808]